MQTEPAAAVQTPPPTEPEETRVMPLQDVDVESALRMIGDLFRNYQTKIAADARSNSIIMRGPTKELDEYTRLIEELESLSAAHAKKSNRAETGANADLTALAKVSNAVKPVEALRGELRALEQQCEQAASEVRKNPTHEAGRKLLSDLVERAFDTRSQLQRAEIAASAKRLEKIQLNLENREKLKSQVVERRVTELLNPRTVERQSEPTNSSARSSEDKVSQSETVRPADNQSDQVLANAKPVVETSDLLRTSPTEMRSQLRKNAEQVVIANRALLQYRDTLNVCLAEIKAMGEVAELLNKKKAVEAALHGSVETLRRHGEDLRFAKLQYDQIIYYLQVGLIDLNRRQEALAKEYQTLEMAFKEGQLSRFELSKADERTRELDVEKHRLSSLLRLYEAAADVQELKEAEQVLSTK